MLNIYLVLALQALQGLAIVFLIVGFFRRRRILAVGLVVLAALFLLQVLWLGGTFFSYWFESTEKNGTLVVVRHARSYPGPMLEVDAPPEIFVGGAMSPMLESLGTYDGGLDNRHDNVDEPARFVWEGPTKCWIRRRGAEPGATGFFVENKPYGMWRLRFVHLGPSPEEDANRK